MAEIPHSPDSHSNSPISSSPPVSGGLSESQIKKSWVKFEEENTKAGESVATIEPSQSFHVDSQSHPLADRDGTGEISETMEAKSPVYERQSSSPISQSVSNLNSSSLPPPMAPLRHIRKSASEQPSGYVQNNIPAAEAFRMNRSSLQSIPLTTGPALPPPCDHGIRQGFTNGDTIVTLLPINKRFSWITKAEFRPELVPEELMAHGLTLTVEDYVMAMQVLVNDIRFNVYIMFYKRVLLVWILLGFIILLSLLFSGIRGLALFGGGIVWLIVNAIGIFICMWLKIKLYRLLEQCVASVNALLYKHNILVGLDDRGKISCHKVNLIFLYFDVGYCIKYLKDMLENEERLKAQQTIEPTIGQRGPQPPIDHSRMDIDTSDIIITGSSTTRVSQKEKYAEKLLLRYSQRWVKEFSRKRLDLNLPLHPDGSELSCHLSPPRHCHNARCPCQFIEEHLRFKPQKKTCNIRDLFS
ncbi:transmembrane protein 268 isoform X2 [Centruroides vittatus]